MTESIPVLPAAQRLVERVAHPPPTVEQLVREYAPRVYSLARRLLGNDTDAEEVTQDVFLQIIRKLPTFRGEATFSTWLYRVTVNTALAYRRKRALRETVPLPEALGDLGHQDTHSESGRRWRQGPPALVLEHEVQQLIEQAIAELPELYRDVFVLADVEELPNAEIAQLLGLSLPAVKSRLHRARLLMRHALASYFEEPSG